MNRTVVLLGVTALFALASALAVPAPLPTEPPASGDGRVAAHTPTSTSTPSGGANRSRRADLRTVEDALIVNANAEELPPGCSGIAGERNLTVRAGRRYAAPGEMFAYDTDRIDVPPCIRLTVTFVNEDRVRHQWMVHGLPRETYPMGMFSIELTGPGRATATFVVPSSDRTLRVHCSLPQHEQKGMRTELVVGEGDEQGADGTAGTTSGTTPGFGLLAAVAGITLALLLARRAGL